MTRKLTLACALTLALATLGSAQTNSSSTGNGSQYSKTELKRMAQDAHTPSQYVVLAGYYGNRQTDFLAQAAEEKREWVRRSANIVSIAAKYPRPVDSAHYLYDYYTYRAMEAGQLAAKYSQLAGPSATKTN
jgi:hypothetical protein